MLMLWIQQGSMSIFWKKQFLKLFYPKRNLVDTLRQSVISSFLIVNIMKLMYQNRSGSQKKQSFWRSVTTAKPLRNQSQDRPIHHNPFQQLIDIGLSRSDKLMREGEKRAHCKRKNKKESEQSQKKKQPQHQTMRVSKTFIGSKLEKKLEKYLMFLAFVNASLRVNYERIDKQKYTVYIGKGNNSKLIKKIFKIRHWWNVTNDQKNPDINLIWTQWSKSAIFSKLKSVSKFQQIPTKTHQFKDRKNASNQYNLLLPKEFKQTSLQGQSDLKHYIKKSKSSLWFKIQLSHNHIQGHEFLTDKKHLFHCLRAHCEKNALDCFDIVPLTFHISSLEEIQPLKHKQKQFHQQSNKCMWIVKPGQKSNRGQGISVFKKVSQIEELLQKQNPKNQKRTYIIQRYLSPALFHRRKFDIRCFVLLIANPFLQAFFYSDGYLRTSSKQFKEKKYDDKLIHLTNDAIQKKGVDYGKYEKGNKLSFEEYQAYLDLFQKKKQVNFKEHILPQLKSYAAKSIEASSTHLNRQVKEYTFELLGYDFMLDEQYKPWLIEVNTNPCLETGCPLLQVLISSMLNNLLKLSVDAVFKPPKLSQWPLQSIFTFPTEIVEANKFEHIYSSKPQ